MGTDPARETKASRSRLQGPLDSVERILAALEKRIAALSMAIIMIAIAVTVIVRVAELPLPSYGELAIVAMAPLTFIGGAYCTYMHRHITIDVVDAFGSARVQRALRFAASLAMAGFAATYAWLTLSLLEYSWTSGESLIDLNTPVWIPLLCIVVGAGLMFLHAALDLLRLLLFLPRTGDAPLREGTP